MACAKLGDGLVQLPLVLQGVAEVVVGLGEFRVEFDGLAVAGDGLVQLALVVQGVAEVVVRVQGFRIEFDGATVAGDGLVQLSSILPRLCQGSCVRLHCGAALPAPPCNGESPPRLVVGEMPN